MFIDEIKLSIYSGKGGNGIVSWMHEKGRDHAGPGGGDGGRGGDVYIQGVRDINYLSKHRFIKLFKAEDGSDGGKKNMTGKSGKDLVVNLPIGSMVKDFSGKCLLEILDDNKTLFLNGGKGGYGNSHFKGPRNVNPKEFTLGGESEGGEYEIELRLVADLGLVGLPNVGKSSLLNTLTSSSAKVGNYQFTTISPNLGVFRGYVIADIPGLIEGASKGRGLGHKFLKHISRTKVIMHCISADTKDTKEDYDIVRKELVAHDKLLGEKKEVILITKSDTINEKDLNKISSQFKKKKDNVFTVSIIDDKSVKKFSDELEKYLEKNQKN